MYGLLVENLASFIRIQWGEGKWDMVRKHTGVDAPSFSIHHVYPETLLNRLARSAFQVLQVDEKQFYEAMGIYFVEYVGQYGYDAMLTVLGRHMRDFLNGLDNLHEYLKFSYTKMRAPSFYCDNETANGLRLHYRSRRRGFVYYVMGQIKQVGKHFYNQDVQIEILSEELDGETMHTIFQMTFDNFAFAEAESLKIMIRKEQQLPIRASIIFELFPFCIVFSPEMTIKFTGHALLTILKDLVGQCMTEAFELVKPLISFSFSTILERRNNIFELITAAPIKDDEALTGSFENDSDEETGTSLRLRGQMLHMEEWNMLLFLANPVMPDLDSLVQAGLFINDLSLHDCSRDLVLAGTQQSVELKLALDQEQQKSKKLEESMKKLDQEMKRTDELLYQMIPKAVADRLRTGENPVDTCEVFESVSILFSDVVTFTDICSRITPMQVVSMLNHMYSLFDQLTERNGVYKVETIGDSYMVVSGAPDPDENHSERICDMAMDMVDACEAIRDPSRDGETIKIRVGCHSGNVVAGVVGHKMPRYCLFGDAVNTASRMESTSTGGRVQISEMCKNRLPSPYLTELRGTVTVKGKGEMNTYWLLGRDSRVPLAKASPKSFNWTAPTASAESVASASAGAAATKNLVSQMSKQISVSSEDGAKGPTSAAGIVKDSPQAKPDFKKLVKQQSKINLNNLVQSVLKTIEPKPAISEPVTMNGEAAQVTPSIVKPTPTSAESVEANRSAFAFRTSPAPQPTIPEVKTPVEYSPKKEFKKEITPMRSSSPFRDLVRSVSPTPKLVPWLINADTEGNKNPVAQPTTSLAIPGDAVNPLSGRRSSSPRIMTNEYGATVVTWVPNEEVPNAPVSPTNFTPTNESTVTPNNTATPANNIAIPTDNTAILANNTAIPANNTATPANNTATPTDSTATPADNTANSLNRQNSLQVEGNENNAEDWSSERQKPVTVLINGINGIRKGSREFRNKIKDKKFSTITAESMTDMGCNEFAAKQKQMMSQACNLL